MDESNEIFDFPRGEQWLMGRNMVEFERRFVRQTKKKRGNGKKRRGIGNSEKQKESRVSVFVRRLNHSVTFLSWSRPGQRAAFLGRDSVQGLRIKIISARLEINGAMPMQFFYHELPRVSLSFRALLFFIVQIRCLTDTRDNIERLVSC